MNKTHPAPEIVKMEGREAAARFVELLTSDTGNPLSWRLIHDSTKTAEAFNHDNTLDYLANTFLERQENGYGVFAVVNGSGHRDAGRVCRV